MIRHIKLLLAVMFCCVASQSLQAQELNCKVRITHSQVQGTKTEIFETLENVLTEFMNNRAWTSLQYAKDERIDCSLNITIKTYNESENRFTGDLLFQVTRPVFNSAYSSLFFQFFLFFP